MHFLLLLLYGPRTYLVRMFEVSEPEHSGLRSDSTFFHSFHSHQFLSTASSDMFRRLSDIFSSISPIALLLSQRRFVSDTFPSSESEKSGFNSNDCWASKSYTRLLVLSKLFTSLGAVVILALSGIFHAIGPCEVGLVRFRLYWLVVCWNCKSDTFGPSYGVGDIDTVPCWLSGYNVIPAPGIGSTGILNWWFGDGV